MTRAELVALALRVEREEPSRKLNEAIATAVIGPQWGPLVLPYTTSLDAAASLVPDRWIVEEIGDRISGYQQRRFTIAHREARLVNGFYTAVGKAPTEPRARTAAALRALAMEARAALEPQK